MKRIFISLVVMLFSSLLFAEKLNDEKIMQVMNNYDFIDSYECDNIPETCGIEYKDVFVLFSSENNMIVVYSTNANCNVSAKECAKLICVDFHGENYKIYKI